MVSLLTKKWFPVSLALWTSVTAQITLNYCPLLGPIYPPPTTLANDAAFSAALQNITSTLNEVMTSGNLSTNSISLQIFDATNPSPLLSFSYTGSDIDTTLGVSTVDENTVFRVGSVSKLWTILMFIAEEGLWTFQQPIARFVPELRRAAVELRHNRTRREDKVDYVQWDEITIGDLASHLAGIGRDYGILDFSEMESRMIDLGFPALPRSQIPPCGVPEPCNRKQFFNGLLRRHPIVPTSRTPIYSNAAFQILAYALETITGHSYPDLLQRDIIRPLGLTGTYYDRPNSTIGVIPSEQGEYFWNMDLGDENPAGGIYSSTRDMTALGQAILNNTLVAPSITRKWMKPVTHTSSLDFAVGAPWEIISFGDNRPIDLYTKSGDIGVYSSTIVLSSDHAVGFTIQHAGKDGHANIALLSDLVSATLLPALDQSAKDQAEQQFTGYFAASAGTNSSINITTDAGPGLLVTSWISNGTDMFQSIMSLQGIPDPSLLSIRLYPTGLVAPDMVSFRALIPPTLPTAGHGPFTSSCITWVTVDSAMYGSVALDEFVFNLDDQGDVVSVSPRILRITLPKT
ncbi:hypothetical protein N7462_009236 [Penicillium macrosclerotiorum]|uniref:uncharacterized protein n=1 Tax=Penicillium macrosclerotiorum TaxID=303699 RepID=UPI002547B911|nr:uncharacterized protein N7462_009236 [Penicillium macrosclerotiorum]KAJ5673797.1 hypothetical protein N7462_009236 [Penicillium macrosclerotiorum]